MSQKISFARLGVRDFDLLGDGNTFAYEDLDGLDEDRSLSNMNFMAIVGDGDGLFEAGETAYKLSDFRYGGRLTSLEADTGAPDPVSITGHGRLSEGEIGDLTGAVRFTNKYGFGLNSGPEIGKNRKFLNGGDSLTFDTADAPLELVEFSVDLKKASGTGSLLLDIDGNVITTADGDAEGAATRFDRLQDALAELGDLAHGQRVAIDFLLREVRVDGVARDGFDAFFDAFEASGANKITIGSTTGRPVALADMTFTTGDVPTNEAPEAVQDAFAVDEDGSVTFSAADLLANDTDPDGDTLVLEGGFTASSSDNPDIEGGTITDNGNGSFTFRPSQDAQDTLLPGQTNAERFIYQISDGNGGTAQGTIVFTVSGVNPNDPVAKGETFRLTEGQVTQLSNLLSNDTDADGDSLSIVSVEGQAGRVGTAFTTELGASLTINADGSFTYDATDAEPLGFSGVDSFSYTVSDGYGGTDEAEVTFFVEAVNDAPETVIDILALDEDGSYTFTAADLLANDTDAEGDALSIVGGFTYGESANPAIEASTITDNGNGTFTFRPSQSAIETLAPGDLNGEFFTYTVSDGRGGSTPGTVIFNVSGVNRSAPDVSEETFTRTEGQVYGATNLLANDSDPDGDPLSIVAVDDNPALVGTSFLSELGALVTIKADGSFTYDATDAEVTGFSGNDSFTYTVSDGYGKTSTGDVTIFLRSANDTPETAFFEVSTGEASPLSFSIVDLGVSDPDVGDTHSVTVFSIQNTAGGLGPGQLVDNGDGTFRYTPPANALTLSDGDTATQLVRYTVRDAAGAAANGQFEIEIQGAYTAPVAVADEATVDEDGSILLDVLANDFAVDSDGVVELRSVGEASNGTLQIVDGQVRYTPDADFAGSDAFSYTIGNGGTATDTGSVVLTVSQVDDAPVAVDDAASSDGAGVDIDVLANDSDLEGDALSVQSVGVAANGTVSINEDGTVNYTPDSGYRGEDTFSYVLAANGLTDTATVTVTVNDAPEAGSDTFRTGDNDPLQVNVLNNDSDPNGDALTVVEVRETYGLDIGVGVTSSDGIRIDADGTLTYDPRGRYDFEVSAVEAVTYVVADASGATDTATVTIYIDPQDDPAEFGGDLSGDVTEDSNVDSEGLLTATGTATVVDQDSIIINDNGRGGLNEFTAETIAGTYGSLTIGENGAWTYSADNSQSAIQALGEGETLTDVLTISQVGGSFGTEFGLAQKTIEITIHGVNDAPEPLGDTFRVGDNEPLLANVLDNDDDPNGDALTVVEVQIESGETLSAGETSAEGIRIDADGTISFDPNGRYDFNVSALESLTYTVEDSYGLQSSARVEIYIDPQDDPAVFGGDLTGAVTEDTGLDVDGFIFTSGAATVADADMGFMNDNGTFGANEFTAETVVGTYGALTIQEDGNWSYKADNSQAAIQDLAAGESLTDSLTIRQVGANSLGVEYGLASETIEITIWGVDEIV